MAAIEEVPRHLFVSEALETNAHRNTPLPIGEGQTISAPDVVARMSEALALGGHETVLEIGTGSGYQAAVLSRLASRVISIERIPVLATRARALLDRIGVRNVEIRVADGSRGWPDDSPYEAIAVTAAGPEVPEPLIAQLAAGGRLVGPFGDRNAQDLVRITKGSRGPLEREVLGRCRFVDLVGEFGWPQR